MALGDAIQKRMEELSKRQAAFDARLATVAEGATLRAVEEAQDHTPPNTFEEGELRGVHMITGELAQHWETDSQTVPKRTGVRYTTVLANSQDYASYVNDGHFVKRHFVPGLYIDDDGLLSYEPTGKDKKGKKIGLIVGTKTTEVPGLNMKEKAVERYRETVEAELPGLAKEMLE